MENISAHLSVIDGINGISYTSNRFILGLLKPGLTDFFLNVCGCLFSEVWDICQHLPPFTHQNLQRFPQL